MTHLWVRAESRPDEARVGVTPDGVAELKRRGFDVTVEDDPTRAIPIGAYRDAGARVAPPEAWRDAPQDAIILGLKELPDDSTPLRHRHVMFGHAFKGQPDGRRLLARFRDGGGCLYDLEYLTDETGRRVAAFGYWAGFAGAAVSALAWSAQSAGRPCPPVAIFPSAEAMAKAAETALAGARPNVLIIGALGRVGSGAHDLCRRIGLPVTAWDVAETAGGGPYPEVLSHEIFLNCILAQPGAPVFVPSDAGGRPRQLRVIGDIACDPTSDFSPVRVYGRTTTWAEPVIRVHDDPPLDVMAIDNLPSLLPLESSEDFAAQLLPHLKALDRIGEGVWGRARDIYERHAARAA